MIQTEQVFFTDHSVYISNNRLVLRKGGTYPVANLTQVTFGRVPASRSWIGFLIVGLIFLAIRAALSQNSVQARSSVLVIGGSLLLIGFVGVLFQLVCPLYVVVLKGNFGAARPIKRRNRHYIVKVVAALNETISKRDVPNTIVQSTHIGQLISGIKIGQGAQANIGTSGNARNMNQASDAWQPISEFNAFNNSSASTSSNEARPGRRVNDWNNNSHRANQPVSTGAGARKIIISYSHEDRQWLDLLRTHLAPLEQQHMIEIWDDTQIAAGMHTQQAMTDALKTADFALLLFSASFLASDVIMHYELPQILQRLSLGTFIILPLILSPCLYIESPLRRYQPFNPNDPLSRLPSPRREDVLVRVAKEIRKAVA